MNPDSIVSDMLDCFYGHGTDCHRMLSCVSLCIIVCYCGACMLWFKLMKARGGAGTWHSVASRLRWARVSCLGCRILFKLSYYPLRWARVSCLGCEYCVDAVSIVYVSGSAAVWATIRLAIRDSCRVAKRVLYSVAC